MKHFIILFCIMPLLLCGCAAVRRTAIDISEEEKLNAEAAREVALNYLSIWQIQSGFIRGALGSRINELPIEVVEAMDELDELSNQHADPNGYTDAELGKSLGLRVRILMSIVEEALDRYLPGTVLLF